MAGPVESLQAATTSTTLAAADVKYLENMSMSMKDLNE
jgi:hypothetical protein